MSDKYLFSVTGNSRKIITLFFLVITIIWLVPVVSALYRSFRFMGISNYSYVLTSKINEIYFFRALANSFIIAAIAVMLTTFVSAISGYSFSKLDFPFRNTIYLLTLCLLSVPGITILVPLFFTIKKLGLNNTFFAVALPQVALTLPFGVLLMRNSFDVIHNDYRNAASIDGANPFQIFLRIYLPMNKGAAINLAILQFIWSFQDFLLPTYFLSKRELTTATQMVSSFNRTQTVTPKDLGAFSAALVLLAVPVIIVYLIFSQYIKRGITSGGIKA